MFDQQPDDAAAAHHRVMESGKPVVIRGVDVRASIQAQLHRLNRIGLRTVGPQGLDANNSAL